MSRFVCVRLIQANALDLNLFQFDYDLTFAAFFLNADRTIYGRFGTRSKEKADLDISLSGFAEAMEGALELHKGYPGNRERLAGKQSPKAPYAVPEDYPSLKGKFKATLDYDGPVARSCIHCHQVGEAQRLVYRGASEPIPQDVLFPWPMPDALGLSLDPLKRATVKEIAPSSPAARAGFRPGDAIDQFQGQPILSVADVQWVLHRARDGESLDAEVRRGGATTKLTLALPENWRARGDLSWRPTTWDLRRMSTGGLLMESMTTAERSAAGLGAGQLGLKVKHVGQYGEHATAKNAGFLKDDIVVAWDGVTSDATESDLIARTVQNRKPGGTIEVTVLRGGERKTFELLMK